METIVNLIIAFLFIYGVISFVQDMISKLK